MTTSIPTFSLDKQKELANKKKASLEAKYKRYKKAYEKIHREIAYLEMAVDIIECIKKTRGESDPGKYGPAYFLLSNSRMRVEDLDAEIPLEDLVLVECVECGTENPLLMWYEQVEDSPFGDTWCKQYHFICLTCPRVAQSGETKYSDSRF